MVKKCVILWTLISSSCRQKKTTFFISKSFVFAESFRPNPQVARNTFDFFHLWWDPGPELVEDGLEPCTGALIPVGFTSTLLGGIFGGSCSSIAGTPPTICWPPIMLTHCSLPLEPTNLVQADWLHLIVRWGTLLVKIAGTGPISSPPPLLFISLL